MRLILASLLFTASPVLAGEATDPRSAAGLGLGFVATTASSGDHQVHPSFGLWGRAMFNPWLYGALDASAAFWKEGGDEVPLPQTWVRGAGVLGAAIGPRATAFTVALGPSVTWVHSEVGEGGDWTASRVFPGLRYQAGLLLAPWKGWQADVLFGGSTRGFASDFDTTVHVGRAF